MRSKFFLTICLLLAMIPVVLMAQGTATVTGKITDDEGDPLPGANVLIQLTNIGAATDVDGNFKFTVPSKGVRGQEVKVEARFIGYHTKVERLTLTPALRRHRKQSLILVIKNHRFFVQYLCNTINLCALHRQK